MWIVDFCITYTYLIIVPDPCLACATGQGIQRGIVHIRMWLIVCVCDKLRLSQPDFRWLAGQAGLIYAQGFTYISSMLSGLIIK